ECTPARDMKNEWEGFEPMQFPTDGQWQSNGGGHNHFDGVGNLEMPRENAWLQYLDSRRVGTELVAGTSYAFVIVFKMPDAPGVETMGFAYRGNWDNDNSHNTMHRVFRLDGSTIKLANYTFGSGATLDTGVSYVKGAYQSLMLRVGADDKLTLWYANGQVKNAGGAWQNITPASDPNGLLTIAPGLNIIGANTPD